MATLNGHYAELKEFFVDKVGVRTMTLQLLYDELSRKDLTRTVDQVKSMMFSFAAFLEEEDGDLDAEKLLESRVFPVRDPDGTVTLESSSINFAINDREYLAMRFRDTLKLLDYSMEEVRRLSSFFEWAELTDQYLSTAVQEITSVTDGAERQVSIQARNLKMKAYALLRYVSIFRPWQIVIKCLQIDQCSTAATFKSPRYETDAPGLYETFRTAKVIETSSLCLSLVIFQDGKRVDVEETVGDEHIDDLDDELVIYVPMDPRAQDFCFASALPTKLAAWPMTDEITGDQNPVDESLVTILTGLLGAELGIVDRVLEHKGIIQIPILSLDDDLKQDQDDAVDGADDQGVLPEHIDDAAAALGRLGLDDSHIIQPSIPVLHSASESRNAHVAGAPASLAGRSTSRSNESPQATVHRTAMPRHSVVASAELVQSARNPHGVDGKKYRKLLKVVTTAATMHDFPLCGETSSRKSGLLGTYTLDMGLTSLRHQERWKYTGAAGELYVSYSGKT